MAGLRHLLIFPAFPGLALARGRTARRVRLSINDYDGPVTPYVITMTLYRRPAYTRQVLDRLRHCRGIDKYQVLIFCEPEFPEVIEIAETWQFPNKQVHVNDCVLGSTTNTHQALRAGFKQAEFVIIVEDDILLAPDALRWFEFCRSKFRHDRSIFSAGGYNRREVPRELYSAYYRTQWFTPWGWGTWKDRFEEMSRGWGFNADVSWDWIVNHKLRGQRCEIVPHLARTQNIGGELGTYCPESQWHRENQFNEFWSGMDGLQMDDAGEYIEASA